MFIKRRPFNDCWTFDNDLINAIFIKSRVFSQINYHDLIVTSLLPATFNIMGHNTTFSFEKSLIGN